MLFISSQWIIILSMLISMVGWPFSEVTYHIDKKHSSRSYVFEYGAMQWCGKANIKLIKDSDVELPNDYVADVVKENDLTNVATIDRIANADKNIGVTYKFYDTTNTYILHANLVLNKDRVKGLFVKNEGKLRCAATHEFGHFLGLTDNYKDKSSVMYYEYYKIKCVDQPSVADIDSLNKLYPF